MINLSVGMGEYADQAYTYNTTSGNLSSKTGLGTYNYDSTQPHAVDSVTGWSYLYDANGNMTRRDPAGTDYYDYVYDSENLLYQAKKNGIVIATMTYDGDGNRVKSVLGATTTAFVGGYYEVTAGVITKYYAAGGTRIAMRSGSTFNWLFTDHLSSTSIVATAAGTLQDRILYKAWGEVRSGGTGTRYTYTGQYTYATSGTNDFGLMYYEARWYDPLLSRWAQADTIVPGAGNPQAWDRYAYVFNNPLSYTDPTGHNVCDGPAGAQVCADAGDGLTVNQPTNPPDDPVSREWMCNNGTCYHGDNMYKLYEKYKNAESGWWLDRFGYGDDFTVEDFFIIILAFEMSTMIKTDPGSQGQFSYAISSKYSYWCAQNSATGSCPGVTDNAMLNYLATRGSAWKRYDPYIGAGIPTEFPYSIYLPGAIAVVQDALDNITAQGTDSMNDWGNDLVTGAFSFEFGGDYRRVIFPYCYHTGNGSSRYTR